MDKSAPRALSRHDGGPCRCDRDEGRRHAGKPFKDFGPGFYTTTLLRQAEYWAHQLAFARASAAGPLRAAVVELRIPRTALALAHTLGFIRGDFEAEDFWGFVFHCRSGSADHNTRDPAMPLYDVIYGPVAADWQQRSIFQGADQISFHTGNAEAILNQGLRRRLS